MRTNVAIELASAQDGSGIPYHPHSHRSHYVVTKFDGERERARFSAQHLLQFVSTEVELRNEQIISNLEGAFAFPTTREHAPLIMTVLSGVKTPDEILKQALEIRETREAKNYRKFVSDLLTTFDTGNVSARREAVQKVAEAKALLIGELDKLYGRKAKNDLTIVPKLVAGAVTEIAASAVSENNPNLAYAKAIGKVAEISTFEAIQRLKDAPGVVRKALLRRRIAFLLKLATQERGTDTLNGFLKRIFRRQFSAAELTNFADLYRDRPQVSKTQTH